MEADPHPEWNVALEEVIRKEGEQAEGLYWLHNQAASWALRRNDRIQIPSIILATVTGFFSATSELLPPVVIGALSVVVGILNTINSYFKYAQKAEGHRIAALWYLKTYKNIECQLSLPISQRVNAEDFLRDLRENMARVSETAPPLPEAVTNAFREKFKSGLTAKPIEANGLDQIIVYRGEDPKTPRTAKPEVKITVLPSPTPSKH